MACISSSFSLGASATWKDSPRARSHSTTD